MSIYKHNYQAYGGKVTSVWSRIFVLARYAFAEAWSSKITVVLFVICMLPPVVWLFIIYIANNPAARLLMAVSGPRFPIDGGFFLKILMTQAWLALVLTSWLAPRLITLDLVDNALPILLSHPISRFGYVLGKFVALFAPLSIVTWIPCLLLFAYQGYSSPVPWTQANLRIAAGMLEGTIIWIALISMLGLAISSWVRWRVVATGAIFAAVLIPASVGSIVNAVLRTKWGLLLNLPLMMFSLWERLLVSQARRGDAMQLPTQAIVAMILLACGLFSLMLNQRIRAREVVRG